MFQADAKKTDNSNNLSAAAGGRENKGSQSSKVRVNHELGRFYKED